MTRRLIRSKPVYFDHPLSKNRRLVASWSSYARYLKKELPEAWEIMPRSEISPLETQCKESGSQWFSPGYKRRQQIDQQIRISQMSPEQLARHQARQAEKKEREARQQEQARKRQYKRWESYDLFGHFEPIGPQSPFYGLTRDEAKARYRQLAKECHPDAGGQEHAFIRLNADYEDALKWFSIDRNALKWFSSDRESAGHSPKEEPLIWELNNCYSSSG